jgi:hypothetical protein
MTATPTGVRMTDKPAAGEAEQSPDAEPENPDWALEAERVILSMREGKDFNVQVFELANHYTDHTAGRMKSWFARLFRRGI